MNYMAVEEVAEFLNVQDVRVRRLKRKSYLPAADKDTDARFLLIKKAAEKYKELARRSGGL